MSRGYRVAIAGWALLAGGCDAEAERRPADLDLTPVPRVSQPLTGGAAALADGVLVASDVDRDRVHLVDLAARADHVVELPEGWAPGAVAAADGRAFVALRGPGAL